MNQLNISLVEALFYFNLAPLSTRRCMAMLAVIQRSIFGLGPNHFRTRFRHSVINFRFRRYWHYHQLKDPYDIVRSNYFNRLIFDIIVVYN